MNKDFKSVANSRLSGVKVSAGLKYRILSDIKQMEEPQVKKKLSLSAAIALALILITAAAFALTDGFGLFELMASYLDPEYAVVQPDAFKLLQKDLARADFEHVEVTVKEAVYDGRYLRVVHSTRDKSATEPFDKETAEKINNGEFEFGSANQDKVWWLSLDWAVVNGHNVNPLGACGVVAGPGNGEVISWIQYDMSEIEVGDTLEVILPIRGRQSIENKELSFTMDVKDLPGVYHLKEVAEKDFGAYSLKVTNFQLSPIRVYLSYDLTFKPGVLMEEIEKIMDTWAMGEKHFLGNDKGDIKLKMADWGGWGYDIGEHKNTDFKLEEGEDYGYDVILDPTKPVVGHVFHEYLTLEEYPDTFVLSNGTDKIEIPNVKAE
ncbi:MAG: hypothetical protein ACOX6O_00330 [Christensenellales bacterium]|jgi:hypothetical protein